MRTFKGQYDFSEKLKWNPAYIAPPGSGPEFESCQSCVHFGHEAEPNGLDKDGNEKFKHFYFCGLVLDMAGIAKAIKPETWSCKEFEQRKASQEKRKLS